MTSPAAQPEGQPDGPPQGLPQGLPEGLAAAVAGRYEVERELGRGPLATLYLARDLRHDGRPVALKVLRVDQPMAHADERFAREVKILSQLRHRNIAPLYDSGRAGRYMYFVSSHVQGETLRDRMRRVGGTVPVAEAVRIAREVADALDHAHRRGVVHRDVTPENILLASDGQLFVTEFGLARTIGVASASSLTTMGRQAVGTPLYMSPEQTVSGGQEVDGRSDIYSLGIVLYEMLTGSVPFTGADGKVDVGRKLREPPPPPSTLRREIPSALDRVILRALAPLPGERYGSAIEFARALDEDDAAAHAPPGREPRITTPDQDEGQHGRRMVMLLIAGAVLGALLFAIWFLRGG